MIVRYFLFHSKPFNKADGSYGDIVECTKAEFENCPHAWPTHFRRPAVPENGVSQLCLTKSPFPA